MIFSNIVNRTLSSAVVRAPSIRFRYGASRDQKVSPGVSAAPSVAGATGSPQAAAQPGEPIYDFQIPPRWKRRPLSEEEIAYINRGGPE